VGGASKVTLIAIALCGALLAPAYAHRPQDDRLDQLDQRIARDPGSADTHLARSVLHRDRGAFAEALVDLERAAQLDPARVQVDFLRGELFLVWQRPEHAVAPLERFVAREPHHAKAHVLLARALAQSGHPIEAARHFDRAIEFAPVPVPAHYLERARALADAGEPHVDAALRGLDAGMERLGPVVALASYAAELEIARGRYDAALARLEPIATSPPSATWLARRAEILERAERRDEARAAYAQALAQLEQLPVRRRQAPAIAELESHARDACARLSR